MKQRVICMLLAGSILTAQTSSSVYAMGLLDKIGETFSEENIEAAKDQASSLVEEGLNFAGEQWNNIENGIQGILESDVWESLYSGAVDLFETSNEDALAYWKDVYLMITDTIGIEKREAVKWWNKVMDFAEEHHISGITIGKVVIAAFISIVEEEGELKEEVDTYMFDTIWGWLQETVISEEDAEEELEKLLDKIKK